uniref:Uncharacterized protein n=1 Tax=Geospiza parvula TaxID=87175 RepID=A0A8C3QC66_GEOPR
MECNAVVQEGLRHSNARFTASMSRIMEEYSHPFKDDILVSTDTLTCDTPDRPKQWERSVKEGLGQLEARVVARGSALCHGVQCSGAGGAAAQQRPFHGLHEPHNGRV